MPLHGGMAAGVDRIVMLLCGTTNFARNLAILDESAGRGPPDGGAERRHKAEFAGQDVKLVFS
jgi:hypothetical protein